MVEGQNICEAKSPVFDLSDGSKIPAIGLGTFLFTGDNSMKDLLVKAILEHGYRHIDTAMIYNNEEQVGEALQEVMAKGIKREELYITTKLWHTDKNDVEGAMKTSLKKLQLDYVDLYLVHWMRMDVDFDSPEWTIKSPPLHVVWAAMEKLVDAGMTKSIGVSNCTIPVMFDMLTYCRIRPVINQIEVHPYFQQTRVKQFHEKYGIKIQAYAAIGSGHWTLREDCHKDVNVLTEPVIKAIAEKHGRSPAQVVINWHISRGVIPLVKTSKEARLTENICVSDFTLDQEDLAKIEKLDANIRLYNPMFIDGFGWNGMPYYN